MPTREITINWIITNYLDYLKQFQLDEISIRHHFDEWKKEKKAKANKYLWYIFEKVREAISKQATSEIQRCRLNAELFKKMWEYKIKIENKNANDILKLQFENQLHVLKLEQTVYRLEIEVISGHCCLFCNSLNGKKLSLEEALSKQPLASDQCTRQWGCNCCYAENFARDSNNRFIKK